MLGANGIVGGGPPLICSTALAAKLKGDRGVGVAFFGDGASNQGTTLEAMNLASVWNLPAIFVAENNGYAEATSSTWSVAADNIADRAAGFGVIVPNSRLFWKVRAIPRRTIWAGPRRSMPSPWKTIAPWSTR